ncbi:helix-turn-helix transcriptional regulator [Longispora albida]|uniref:helix-turn-helix transcriptional regulator n=1 Tax=Longispora albida TaxID=203523 RepID=UPI0003733A99|nr:helix-turn-helix transcriptional regulator [Longispora albida]
MTGDHPDPDQPGELDDRLVPLYRWVIRNGVLDPERAAADLGTTAGQVELWAAELTRLELLRPCPGDRVALVAVSPEAAAATLLTPVETELRQRLAHAERLRAQLTALGPAYADEHRRRSRPGHLHDLGALVTTESLETVTDLIGYWNARCQTEVLTSQPRAGRLTDPPERVLEENLEVLARGVAQRTLYQHAARANTALQRYVHRVTAAGAQVRTLPEVFGKMIAFDRQIAFLPRPGSPTAGAIVIREPSLVAYLCHTFDTAWSMADPYLPAHRGNRMPDDTKEAITRMLADGMKDEQIARRLGMSIRTCRKHIAELMERLGATSRFQFGYLSRPPG